MNFYITIAILLGGVGLFAVWGYLQTRHDERERKEKKHHAR